MGDIVPFKRKRSWTRPEDYIESAGSQNNGGGNGGKPPRKSRRPRITAARSWIVLSVIIIGYVLSDPALVEPPGLLSGEPEHVTGKFTECGKASSANCVIDGDTIRIGDRSIRIVGVDAPETSPSRCPAEAAAGAKATAKLLRLTNAGPFTMTGRLDGPTDKYGRELRTLTRTMPDGSTQSFADELLASGAARSYAGGLRRSWCPGEEA